MLHNPDFDKQRGHLKLPLLLWADDIEVVTDSDYLIKNLIHRGDFSSVYGPSGTGKTFWYLDALFHVLLGKNYRGLKVRQGGGLIVALEGQRGLKHRIIGQRRHHKIDIDGGSRLPLAVWQVPIDFAQGASTDVNLLVQTIKAEFEEAPAIIVIDTLARAMGGGDENNPRDMGNFLRSVDYLQVQTGSHVMVVHHTGKDVERGPRGHSSLYGAADTLIEISRPKDAAFSLARVIKQKDGPKGQEFAFDLRQVEVGIDEDGDPITSCVVVPTDEAVPLKGRKKMTLPPSAMIALKALQEAVSQCGESPPSSNYIPSSVKTVTESLWRRYAYQMGISSSGGERAKQAAFKRAAERLISLELVGQWGQTCWLCS